MSLDAGARLGPYEILSPLGAGGMGEVYEARDTRLDRTVAIKVLPSHLAQDSERRDRFEREARAVAALSHPHICTLHDVGSEDDVDFLVMERLEGETLADRLEKGPLPLDEALRYGVEITGALDRAHREGIVHRDLKPGNIMLTPSGAKLLDFGLAKLAQAPVDAGSAIQTEAKPLTSDGAILGTFQYMAPEQLEGKEADARTDIFAFGAVLYEMLTGKKAFEGNSRASLIAAIIERQPERLASLQPATPHALDRVLSKCLAKAPQNRWAAAEDVKELLQWVVQGDLGVESSAGTEPSRTPWAIAAVAVLAAVAATLMLARAPTPDAQPVGRFVLSLPESEQLNPTGLYIDLAVSPNGEYIAYSGGSDARQLYVRRLNQLEATLIANTGDNPRSPFFSPDSQWVGYFAERAVKKVSVSGGPSVTLCEVPTLQGASWGEDGDIILAAGDAGLLRVSSSGGDLETLTTPEGEQTLHLRPEILPGGNRVLFEEGGVGRWRSEIALLSLETGDTEVLIPGGSTPRYAASGHIVYAADGSLRAAAFDAERAELIGNPFPVVDEVHQKDNGAANYSVSQNGTLVLNPRPPSGGVRRLSWVDRAGRAEHLSLEPGHYNSPALSPDGRQLALTVRDDSGSNLWIYDIERRTLGKRTFDGENYFPIWIPDGSTIVFSNGRGYRNMARVAADGSTRPELLLTAEDRPGYKIPISWSPDNRWLLFEQNFGVWKLSLDDDGVVEPVLNRLGVHDHEARFSPNGQWFAYRSDETGRDEVYVQSFPGPGGKWQVSVDGGTQPMWSADGRELFFKSGDKLMAVDVKTDSTFDAETPRVLFEQPLPERTSGDPSRFGVSPDGERFLVISPAEDEETKPAEIHVVVNWFQELERLAPSQE